MQITSDSEVSLKIHHSTRFCSKYKAAFFSLYCDRCFEISSAVFDQQTMLEYFHLGFNSHV